MKLQPIKDIEGYKKDKKSNAILSIDNFALKAYKQRKISNNKLINEIDDIKNDLAEIRETLKLIIQKGN